MKNKKKQVNIPEEEIPLEEQLARRQSAPQPTFQDEARNAMQEQMLNTQYGVTEGMKTGVDRIGTEEIRKAHQTLLKYKEGKANLEQRIVENEQWYKLRHWECMRKEKTNQVEPSSGWLFNSIANKHADAMESYPEPNILPREEGDMADAKMLSDIIPCILEHNQFETTYSNAMWQKMKTGTGVYKVVWDQSKLNGLGDIAVERVNLLNVYWEPGITDIQNSRYFFHTELYDKEVLEEMFPQLKDKLKGKAFTSSKFLYDDHVDTENKITVIDVYYHKIIGGKKTLQYCKYVNDIVLFASENVAEMAERGFYDHGKFPYVFDALFPIEGSPCGYGYVDLCRNPQTEIDLLKTSFVKNAMVGASPRYFSRVEGSVNEEEFLDLSNPIVHVSGSVDDQSLRPIEYNSLDGNYVAVLDRTIQELRETSGNTETSTGNVGSGVTAASAIAALQEASGKGSRDSTEAAYRAFSLIVDMCIELIRQFYDMPRQFRILGQYGTEQFTSYDNSNLQPIHQGYAFGQDQGFRLPVFDIKVSAQKKNVYTKVTQNELALQLFDKGFFNPQMTDQALTCLDLMDFDGKDIIMQKIARNGTMFQKLIQYMQMSLVFAQAVRPDMVQGISQDIMQTIGGMTAMGGGGGSQMMQSDHIAGIGKKENTRTQNARERSSQASQPNAGSVVKENK